MKKIIIPLILFVVCSFDAAHRYTHALNVGEKSVKVPTLWQDDKNSLERDFMPALKALVEKDPNNVNAVYVWGNMLRPSGDLTPLIMAVDKAHVEGAKYLLEHGAHPTARVRQPRREVCDPLMNNFSWSNKVAMDTPLALVVGSACPIRFYADGVNGLPLNRRRLAAVSDRDLKKAHDEGRFPLTMDEIDRALSTIQEQGYFPNEQALQPYLPQLPRGVSALVYGYQWENDDQHKKYCYIERGKRYITIFNMMKAKQRELEAQNH